MVLVHTSCGMSAIQDLMGSSIFIGVLRLLLVEYFSFSKKQNRKGHEFLVSFCYYLHFFIQVSVLSFQLQGINSQFCKQTQESVGKAFMKVKIPSQQILNCFIFLESYPSRSLPSWFLGTPQQLRVARDVGLSEI